MRLRGCADSYEPSLLIYSVDKDQHLKTWLTNVFFEKSKSNLSGNAERARKRVRSSISSGHLTVINISDRHGKNQTLHVIYLILNKSDILFSSQEIHKSIL